MCVYNTGTRLSLGTSRVLRLLARTVPVEASLEFYLLLDGQLFSCPFSFGYLPHRKLWCRFCCTAAFRVALLPVAALLAERVSMY